MSNCVVTGVAGFIGSHLAERLVSSGHQVTGIDCFTDYYPRTYKEANLERLFDNRNFHFVEADLLDADLLPLLSNVDYVFHQAAQPGVRKCWGSHFSTYVSNNILSTQHLLETVKQVSLTKLIVASTSSIYGDAEGDSTPESVLPRPKSPYGVSKLAAEHLCNVYASSFGFPVVVLRYFTVYGPRQRPDMAFHIFIKAMLQGEEIVIFGDGNQSRDFTFVDDAVEANILAMDSPTPTDIFNIGGGSRVTVNETLQLLEKITGITPRVRYAPGVRGEARRTAADIRKAQRMLGYEPKYSLAEGLTKEVEWLKASYVREEPAQAAAMQFQS
jgi:nucleoside-diphosphate-sugar epimerase